MSWEIRYPHVLPINDTREHEESDTCWCHPTTDEDGVVTHHSADQRELFETGERKAS